jgi:heme/copper-type cytochrome/quinol oxidase subunit 4
MQQRFALISVLVIPVLVGALWLLDVPPARLWWLFALAAVQVVVGMVATIRLRTEGEASRCA